MANLAFTLSLIVRHAFLAGAGVEDNEKIPDDVQKRWVEYEPHQAVQDKYDSIVAALAAPNSAEPDMNITDEMVEHFHKMQQMATDYLVPEPYIARFPKESNEHHTVFELPGPHHGESAQRQMNNRRDQAFISDIIRMLDGPEERAALAAAPASAEPVNSNAEVWFDWMISERPPVPPMLTVRTRCRNGVHSNDVYAGDIKWGGQDDYDAVAIGIREKDSTTVAAMRAATRDIKTLTIGT